MKFNHLNSQLPIYSFLFYLKNLAKRKTNTNNIRIITNIISQR